MRNCDCDCDAAQRACEWNVMALALAGLAYARGRLKSVSLRTWLMRPCTISVVISELRNKRYVDRYH